MQLFVADITVLSNESVASVTTLAASYESMAYSSVSLTYLMHPSVSSIPSD